MAGEPTEEDGPLFRHAYNRADAYDSTEAPAERTKALAGFLSSAVVALLEGFLREALLIGAVGFSLIVAVIGVTSGEPAWVVGCVAAGVVGAALPFIAQARHWAFGRQWATILGVLLVQSVLMVVFWTSR